MGSRQSYQIPGMEEHWPAIPRRYKAGECPRVTGLLDATLPKDLVRWAANCEAQAWEAAISAEVANPTGPGDCGFLEAVLGRLGGVREHVKVLEEAADLGSHAHALVEAYVLRMMGNDAREPEAPSHLNQKQREGAQLAAMAAEDWIKEVGLVPMAAERTLHSITHRVAGTADVIGTVKGRPAVADWKSSKSIYLSHLVQATAYCEMAVEMELFDLDHGRPDAWIVQMPKTLESMDEMVKKCGRPIHAVCLTPAEQAPFRALWYSCLEHFNCIRLAEQTMRQVVKPERQGSFPLLEQLKAKTVQQPVEAA